MRKHVDGFTLVELMVVVVVIGILVAVAVPVFTTAKVKAEQNACQANQRTWAGVVEQIKANANEPGASSAGYKTLSAGAEKSVWYDAANTYLKTVPKCPSAAGTFYWVYDTPRGDPGNGGLVACGGATEVEQASTAGHLIYSKPSGAHRYWRILATDESWSIDKIYGAYVQKLCTVSFYASADGSEPDLCLHRTSTFTRYEASYPSQGATDGDTTTSWRDYPATPNWWGIDLGVASEVHAVGLITSSSWYSKSYVLQWSDDELHASPRDKVWHTQTSFNTTDVGTGDLTATFTNL